MRPTHDRRAGARRIFDGDSMSNAPLRLALLLLAAAASAAFAAGAEPGRAAPKEFGTSAIEYTEIASAFRGVNSRVGYTTGATFAMFPEADATWLIADLEVPDGALLQRLTMFYLNDNLNFPLTLSLCRGWNRSDGGIPGFDCPWSLVADSFVGNAAADLFPINTVIRASMDMDGDGIPDDVRWMVLVYFPSGTPALLRNVRAAWSRQVSPAPPVATFNDVPTGDARFAFVEALAASGITAGCGGGAFCPNAALTRGQMAVFLAKALGLHWSSSTPP
jgi:hypothetical protein